MAPDLEAARRLVELTSADERHLTGPRRPIVVARARAASVVAPSVAPRSADLGVMLPYTPLHHLLAADAAVPLVLTSGNVSDEPIAFADDDARERLAPIADLFLLHDRPIHVRTDDSVLRTLEPDVRAEPLLIRRSRGYVPEALGVPVDAPPLLAMGAELKSTFAIAKGRRAWVSHHIGDLKNFETLNAFRSGIAHFERLFAVTPRASSSTTSIPTTSRPATRSSATTSSRSASSTITPISPPRSPSMVIPDPQSGRSSTAPGTAPTGRSGAASC